MKGWPSAAWCLLLLLIVACDADSAPSPPPTLPLASVTAAVSLEPQPALSASAASLSPLASSTSPPAGTAAGTQGAAVAGEPGACPAGQVRVPGGTFWAGSSGTRGPDDEHPSFQTRISDLCVDLTEVSVGHYDKCVQSGRCQGKARPRITCNYGRPERSAYPMNCVTWEQAASYCSAQGARLPTETEWEYLARGGAEQRKFSWGNESPDGRACWKRSSSCPTASFPAGAFGLFDVTGNVWEWTSSDHGAYPWPPRGSPHKVYRGGGWSRRFEKWMLSSLRNRTGVDDSGSHLGFRCVQLAPNAVCPYGPSPQGNGSCNHGVDDAECPKGKTWNGVRCARPNEPQCPTGTQALAGFGCSGPPDQHATAGSSKSGSRATGNPAQTGKGSASTSEVVAKPSPNFDADCKRFQAERPRAFRLEGATHDERNAWSSARRCKNRDVGAGWNSVCCP